MSIPVETKLDFDRSVSTEDRFAIRKAIDSFVRLVNKQAIDESSAMISDGVVVEGFSDIPQVKIGFVSMLKRRFGNQGLRMMRFPELKLSFNQFIYHLEGTYEEFADGVLAIEGTIELSLIKNSDGFQFVKIILFPRMMLNEDEQ